MKTVRFSKKKVSKARSSTPCLLVKIQRQNNKFKPQKSKFACQNETISDASDMSDTPEASSSQQVVQEDSLLTASFADNDNFTDQKTATCHT